MAYTQVIEAVMIGVGPLGEAIVNTAHFGQDTAPVDLDFQDYVDAWKMQCEASIPGVFTPDYTAYSFECHGIQGVFAGMSVNTPATPGVVGAVIGPSAPLQIAALYQRRSNGINRHGRGRIFLSPISQGCVDVNGRFTDINLIEPNVIDIFATDLVVTTIHWTPVLWNKAQSTATTVSYYAWSQTVGSVRSRKARFPN